MCGLVSLIAKRPNGFYSPDPDIFQQLLYADAVRGWDATGTFGVTKEGNVDIKKQAVAANSFLCNPSYQEFHSKILPKYTILVGHNRKATHGSKGDDNNAHPFWSENNKIVLVHNGMVANQKDFCTKATVDSEAICNALSLADDPKKVISKVTGAFAFIWYNTEQKKLYFIRNEQRPLFLVETSTTYALVSEDTLAGWIFTRNKQTVTKVLDIPAMELFSLELGTNEIKSEGKVKKETAFFLQTTVPLVTTQRDIITKNGITTINESTGFTEGNYLTNKEAVLRIFKPHKRVFFEVDVAKEVLNKGTGEINYQIVGNVINVDCNFIKVVYFLPKVEYDLADFTCAHSGIITGVSVKQDTQMITLFVKNVEDHRSVISKNGFIITDNLFMETDFDNLCRCCRQQVPFTKLNHAHVELKHTRATLLCPTCTERFQK